MDRVAGDVDDDALELRMTSAQARWALPVTAAFFAVPPLVFGVLGWSIPSIRYTGLGICAAVAAFATGRLLLSRIRLTGAELVWRGWYGRTHRWPLQDIDRVVVSAGLIGPRNGPLERVYVRTRRGRTRRLEEWSWHPDDLDRLLSALAARGVPVRRHPAMRPAEFFRIEPGVGRFQQRHRWVQPLVWVLLVVLLALPSSVWR